LYPIKFEPFGVRKPWGGDGLTRHLGKPLPRNLINEDASSAGHLTGWGESWELSDNDDGMSLVANGPLAGTPFRRLVGEYGDEILGARHRAAFPDRFPLLVKLMDVKGVPSIQVHPDAETARPELGESPKTEAWHIVHAAKDARIWCGTRPGVTADDLRWSFGTPDPLSCLHGFQPKTGQTLLIAARTLHTASGVVFVEVQQNSSTTLRLYDFSGRDVDLDWGLEVVDYKRGPVDPIEPPPADQPLATILECDEFVIKRILIDGAIEQDTAPTGMHILTMLSGSANLAWHDEEYPLQTGETLLVPASAGEYRLDGAFEALQSYLP